MLLKLFQHWSLVTLSTGSCVPLTCIHHCGVWFIFWVILYFLVLQGTPGSSCIFLASVLVYLPNLLENYVHTNLHEKNYNNVIPNWKKLKAAKMLFNRWIDNLWYIPIVEYHSAIKENILSHEIAWMNLKCILLCEKSQSEKATYHMIQLYGILRKAKL